MANNLNHELERYYSVRQVADYLNVDPKTVRSWIKHGGLAATKPGGAWRISGKDLRRFLHDRWTG